MTCGGVLTSVKASYWVGTRLLHSSLAVDAKGALAAELSPDISGSLSAAGAEAGAIMGAGMGALLGPLA